MRLGAFAMIIATLGLAACDGLGRPKSGAGECAGRFPAARHAPGTKPPETTLAYAFEMQRNADPALVREGIEGVRPSRFVTMTGTDPAAVQTEVQRLLAASFAPSSPKPSSSRPSRSAPSLAYLAGESSWLVYAPGRRFSAEEATRHLSAMCALSSRGIVLRHFSVSPQSGSK